MQFQKFTQILQQYKYYPNAGDIVAGIILYKEHNGFFVDIGEKKAGYLPESEVLLLSKQHNTSNTMLLHIVREFFLITKHDEQSILSIKRLDYIRSWKRIKQFYKEDIIFNIVIEHINKGGIITYLEGIQGFIPKSHIYQEFIHYNKTKKIHCKLLTVQEYKNQLILSNKSATLTLSIHKFKLGELVYGKIILITSYGLFLNIYKIKALLHISELSIEYAKHIYSHFYIQQLIKVKITYINSREGKLSVSQKNIKN
uniref:Ribosomal protein S1 n=1 Tax=Lophocladia kuetzingii TaxID=675577 RepID=A0A1Z1MPQ2_9FLOR|nr:ribosomal protein S1 [Lophocladia kuetzingii]ARW67751.1 ribosomal protein S1 [Lophocladia kuetzingii]